MEENKNWITWLFAVIGGFFMWLIVDVIYKKIREYIMMRKIKKAFVEGLEIGLKQFCDEINENEESNKRMSELQAQLRQTEESIEKRHEEFNETVAKYEKNMDENEKEYQKRHEEIEKMIQEL